MFCSEISSSANWTGHPDGDLYSRNNGGVHLMKEIPAPNTIKSSYLKSVSPGRQ